MKIQLRGLLGCLALAATFACSAQSYPNKTIRFIVPFPPGGSTDLFARVFVTHFAKTLGQPVIVENRGGAGGRIGTNVAAQAAPDGYTFVMVANNFALDPIFEKDLPYDTWKDFVPVSLAVQSPLVLVASNALPPNNVRELAAYVKANPGKVSYGSTGFGTTTGLSGAFFAQTVGSPMLYVNYKAAVQGQTDLAGGVLNLWFGSTAFAKQALTVGRVKLLGQLGKTRSQTFPDLPTFSEQGMDLDVYGWIGIMTRSGTPQAIVNRWQSEITNAGRDPAFVAKVTELGWDSVMSTPDYAKTFIAADYARWAQLIKAANIQLQK